MKTDYFITGIGTEVGKTVASAIVTEALQADYWKPIQAGDLENSDTHTVKSLVSNPNTIFHPNAFQLNTPMSPHAAAEIDGFKIVAGKIVRPKTQNNLVIEGAGGVLVPLNNTETMLDLMKPEDVIILVSRHYLGSINHTLMSIETLRSRGLNIGGIIFNGTKNASTEEVILKMGGIPCIGRIENEPYFDKNVVKEYAGIFKENEEFKALQTNKKK